MGLAVDDIKYTPDLRHGSVIEATSEGLGHGEDALWVRVLGLGLSGLGFRV